MANMKNSSNQPEHPLPEEIQRMQRDETVCKFCGVSYLIHNEIKNLEDKLKAAEQELSHLRGCDKREEQLRHELNTVRASLDQLEESIVNKDNLISKLKTDGEDKDQVISNGVENKKILEENVQKLSALLEQTKQTCNRLSAGLESIQPQLTKQQECITSLRLDVMSMGADYQAKTQEIDKYISQINKMHRKKMETLSLNNSNLEKELSSLQKSYKELDREVAEKHEKLITFQEMETESRSLKSALQGLESHCEILESKNRTSDLEIESFKETIKKLRAELEALHEHLKNGEHASGARISQLQNEVSQKGNDLAAIQQQLADVQDQLQTQLYQHQEILSKANSSHMHTEEICQQLERAGSDLEAMKKEREMMITAHQNQIEQLRESFKNRIAEADKWPQKLEESLSAEKKKHADSLEMLEEKLKQSFVMELQIEKQKHQELLDKYNASTKDNELALKNQMSSELTQARGELAGVHKQLAAAKARSRESENGLRQEIESLKGIINDLEGRLGRLDSASDQKIIDLKSQLLSLQTDLADAKEQSKLHERQHLAAKEEVGFLQDTVRRECEERFELTETLSQAREELLALKRPLGGYVTSGRTVSNSSITPTPPESGRASQSRGVEEPQRLKRSKTMMKSSGAATTPPEPVLSRRYSGQEDNSTPHVVNSSNVGYDGEKAQGPSKGMKGKSTLTESRKRIAQAVGRR